MLTLLPEGRFWLVRLFKTKVLPLSKSPTTATTAPSQNLEKICTHLESPDVALNSFARNDLLQGGTAYRKNN